jgi:hypothetical protein
MHSVCPRCSLSCPVQAPARGCLDQFHTNKQAKEGNHLIVVFTVEAITGSVTVAVSVLFLPLDLRLGLLLPVLAH